MSGSDVGVVGGGIVGLAIAREILRRRPGRRVVVFEAEDELAAHQTGHNSGVAHAGIYYAPGSLKAQLCTRGRELLRDYCAEHGITYQECGKLVVAVAESELGRLDALEEKARRNRVPGLRRVSAGEIAELEPHARGLAALHSPHTAITDYRAVARSFGADIERAGGIVQLASPVTAVERRAGGITVTAGGGPETVDRLVLCAGLAADRMARLVGEPAEPRIIPFRGEYLNVRAAKRDHVRGLIYPVPDPRYPFLGVHFTRRVDGGLEVGPNAVLGLSRSAYGRFGLRPADVASTLGWPGFWRMARRHWWTGAREVVGSLSVRAYLRAARRYVPDIGLADVERGGVGIRAQAVDRDGSLVDDFRITSSDGITSIRNAPSPAATSSLAIAAYVVDQMDLG